MVFPKVLDIFFNFVEKLNVKSEIGRIFSKLNKKLASFVLRFS